MKLLQKTNRYFILYATIIFMLGGLLFYFILQTIVENETSEALLFERDKTVSQLQQATQPVETQISMEKTILPASGPLLKDAFQDTLMAGEEAHELIPYRQLTSYQQIQGKPYKLILRESLIEQEELMLGISMSLLIIFAAILFGLFLVNRIVSQNTWKPFYENLSLLRTYDVTRLTPLHPVNSDIEEFQELNQVLQKMTDKISADYRSLKEFTENASHELQTPLAAIQSNLDLMVEDKSMEEESMIRIGKISQAVQRISKTNQTLLLLAKIENNQFKEREPVFLKQVIDQALEDFDEMIIDKGLTIAWEAATETESQLFNPMLIRILCNNLISNAIRHNVHNGWIKIRLNRQQLDISNSGNPLKTDPAQLFERFKKENAASESPGLGLSLVQKICQAYQMQVNYQYHKQVHKISVIF